MVSQYCPSGQLPLALIQVAETAEDSESESMQEIHVGVSLLPACNIHVEQPRGHASAY